MQVPTPSLSVWMPIIESLLIGILIGAQRQSAIPGGQIGVREFVLIAAVGSLCGLSQNGFLITGALVALVVFATAFRMRARQVEQSGFTTDLSILAVFCLTYVGSTLDWVHGRATAVGLAIILAFFLEGKEKLRAFFQATLTSVEFSDTLRFMALIFIVYPLLPEGDYGPYLAFNPQRIWMFVILVSSVSFVGYFMDKFLGKSVGLKLTAIMGGIASTTAATAAFARAIKQKPEDEMAYWQAATLTNAVQFPRILAFLSVVSPNLAVDAAWPLLAAGAAGVLMALVFIRVPPHTAPKDKEGIELHNPLTLGPALKFGVILAVVIFITKAAASIFGSASLTWTSIVGGLIDVDAIVVSVGDMFHSGQIEPMLAVGSILLAILMNAAFKTAIAVTAGSQKFGVKVALSFFVMMVAAAAVLMMR